MVVEAGFMRKCLHNFRTDIDYMNQYRDFDNDAIRFNYAVGQKFLDSLHASGRHYIPIVDSAIYVPNPNNASDAYVYLVKYFLFLKLTFL